jgi:hypothetical protein
MTSTNSFPDGLDNAAIAAIERTLSDEIARHQPTSALLDGTALERRNRRMAARAAKGIVTTFGVTLAQAVRESRHDRPLAVIPAPVFGTTKRTGRKARRAAARAAANLGQVA